LEITDDTTMKPKQIPGLEISVAGDEMLVHDPSNGKVHVLNATAGKVLELCDGSRTVAEIAVAVANAFMVDTERVRPDVDSILEDFTKLGLLQA
jgi:PqqD family protein of HPr-rel-A system